ncbi:MAG: integrase [Variovorax sp.]|nr:integrase [Variovorax sp.]
MLTDAKIKAAKPAEKDYKLGDTGQLFLHVTKAGGKHWRMNYTYGAGASGKPAQKTLSFGAYPQLTLIDARRKRDEAKALLRDGKDPAVERRINAKAQMLASENTFETVARRWHALKAPNWSKVHAQDVIESLEADIFPAIGDLPITAIKAPKLLDILNVVEARGAIETAHRLRQRLSAIFVYGIAAGVAEADPAASLGKALKQKPRAKNQPSIIDGKRTQDERIAAVRQMIIDCEGERCRAGTKFALRLLALTAVRPGELRFARWDEFEDLDGREPLWRIPAARMKGDEDRKAESDGDHIVPLSRQAVELLGVLRRLSGHIALLFPSERHAHRPISENTIRALLIRAGYYQQHVPHGFRAAFSTIMNERAKAEGRPDDRAVIDLMLAHVPKDKVESAYNRAAFMPRRRELAQEWADIVVADMWPPETYLGAPMRRSIGNPAWQRQTAQ